MSRRSQCHLLEREGQGRTRTQDHRQVCLRLAAVLARPQHRGPAREAAVGGGGWERRPLRARQSIRSHAPWQTVRPPISDAQHVSHTHACRPRLDTRTRRARTSCRQQRATLELPLQRSLRHSVLAFTLARETTGIDLHFETARIAGIRARVPACPQPDPAPRLCAQTRTRCGERRALIFCSRW